MLVSSPGMTSAEHAEIKRPKQENAEGKLTAHSLLDDASTGVQILLHAAVGEAEAEVAVSSVVRRSHGP